MKILISGDFCPQYRVAELFDKGIFSSVLGEVKEIIEQADYSIVNFECPVTDGDEKPITKYGANLKCKESGMQAVKWAGFMCVTLANNHFLDYGENGVKSTLDACKKYNIDHVGGGINIQEASQILYKKIEGQTLAIINCCEHEFSIATESTAGSNPLNPIQQYYAIKEARKNADYVLIIVHGGHEHWQLPSPRMQETYKFFVDAGADAVVNHHQHCYSGYEVYNGKPIFYGLGNFCFDKPTVKPEIWYYGFMLNLILKEKITFDLIPYCQCKDSKNVHILKTDSFNMRINDLNTIIANEQLLKKRTVQYYSDVKVVFENAIEPFWNKYFFFAKSKKILPSFISKKRKLLLANMVNCESHRDKFTYYLNNIE